MGGYIGREPVDKVNRILTEGEFEIASDTIHVTGGYAIRNIAVYINGYRLRTDEFTAEDGFNIDLGEEFPAGTEFTIEEFRTFEVAEIAHLIEYAQWYGKAVGEVFYLRDDLGIDTPPNNVGTMRFIKLTAGDSYNDGLLDNEVVDDTTDPVRVVATADIVYAGSVLNGTTQNLINTERRFLRAGASGTLEDDQFQGHEHELRSAVTQSLGSNQTNVVSRSTTGSVVNSDAVGNPESSGYGAPLFGDETRSRNMGVTAYMRIS